MSMADRIAIVTGAGTGVGKAAALALAGAGLARRALRPAAGPLDDVAAQIGETAPSRSPPT